MTDKYAGGLRQQLRHHGLGHLVAAIRGLRDARIGPVGVHRKGSAGRGAQRDTRRIQHRGEIVRQWLGGHQQRDGSRLGNGDAQLRRHRGHRGTGGEHGGVDIEAFAGGGPYRVYRAATNFDLTRAGAASPASPDCSRKSLIKNCTRLGRSTQPSPGFHTAPVAGTAPGLTPGT